MGAGDRVDTTPPPENKGKTNHELQQEEEAKRAEKGLTVGDGKGFNITNSDGAFSKIPETPSDAQKSLQQDHIDMASARNVAETRGNQTLTDANGNKLNGMMETRPGGKQYFNQPNEDGTWTRSEVLKDNHGNQYLRPVDDKDRPIAGTKTTALKTDSAVTTNPNQGGARGNTDLPPPPQRDNHQKEVAPPPVRDNSNITLDASRTNYVANKGNETAAPAGDTRVTTPAPQGTVSDTVAQPGQPVKEVPRPVVTPPSGGDAGVGTGGNRPAAHTEAVNYGNMTREERAALRDSIRQQHNDNATANKTPEFKESSKPPAPQGETQGQFSAQFRQMDRQKRDEVILNSAGQPGGPPRLEGRISNLPGGDKPGHGPGGDKGPVLPGDRVPGGKPGDTKPGANIDGVIGGRLDKGGLGKDGAPLPIDGKLLAQLQGLGRNPDAKMHLADLIGKFQDGKGLPAAGKDAAIADLFKNMKPEQLSGLKAWLTDSSKNPFDFKSLDAKSQQSLSKVFDGMLSGQGQMSGKLAELLGERGRNLDRVPTGDQTKALLADLFKGLKDSPLGLGKDGNLSLGKDLSSMLGRGLGEKGQTEFKLSMNDLNGMVMKDLVQRLQSKDFMSSLTGMEKSATMGKLPGQMEQTKDSLAQGQKQLDAAGKEVTGRVLSELSESKGANKFNESVKDLLTKSEIGRGLGEKPVDRGADNTSSTRSYSDGVTTAKGAGVDDGGADTKAKTQKAESEEEITRRKQEETKLQEQQLNTQKQIEKDQKDKLDREEKDRLEKEKEEEEKKRQQKLEEEEKKKKDEEAKKYQDQEFSYTVAEGDTLHSIAGKFAGRTAEIIYARNESSGQIQLQDYKGKKYARVFTGQKLIIPNQKYIDDFKKSTMSYGHINFGKIPYGSSAEELQAWQAGMSALRGVLDNVKDDDKPTTRRSFSSAQVTDDDRKANIKSALGSGATAAAAAAGVHKHQVKLGEGLRSIAQKLYNKPSYWRLIAYKNELSLDTDPKGNPVVQLKRGDQIVLPGPEELAAFDRDSDAFLRGEPVAAEPDPVGELENVNLQDVTLTDEQPDMNFSPEEGKPEEQEQTMAASVPSEYGKHAEVQAVSHSTAQHPLPKAEFNKVEIGFDDEADSIWTPNPTPDKLDDLAYIVEAGMLDGDTRGLSLTLQIYSSGEWVTISEYQIFPHTTYVVKYLRNGERTRTSSTLPPKQSMQLARNHYHKNWQNILREYWHS